MTHLISIKNLTAAQIELLIHKAQQFLDSAKTQNISPLQRKFLVNLFYENSTRTRVSFELAAKKLDISVINLDINTSSTTKGETVLDTINTLRAMGCEFFVIRHHEAHLPDYLVQHLTADAHIINAGDGCNEHPTQALLDLLTIYQHKHQFVKLSVGIIGDIAHSRVANSLIAALSCLGCHDIRLIGPSFLLPKNYQHLTRYEELNAGLNDLDVIITLRIQQERLTDLATLDLKQYSNRYCLTKEKLALAKSDAIVLHPGPINRGIEISNEVADGPQSVILQQVSNGVAMRMAVLDFLANSHRSI